MLSDGKSSVGYADQNRNERSVLQKREDASRRRGSVRR
jgi:hypothetical protein